MKLNAMLTKNQIICCGTMNVFFLEFQPVTWPYLSQQAAAARKASVAEKD
jgi:hypothetical protein